MADDLKIAMADETLDVLLRACKVITSDCVLSNCLQRREPMKPAPPVTNMRIGHDRCSKSEGQVMNSAI